MSGAVLVVEPRTLRRMLLIVGSLVCVAGIGVELLHAAYGPMLVTSRFSLSYESNVPTWYSSLLLLACSVALFAIASHTRASKDRWRRDWSLLAFIFLAMSLDETAALHELLNGYGGKQGALYYAWVVPAAAVVLVLGIRYLGFVRALPPPLRLRTVIAGAVYVGGALGFEPILGLYASAHGENNLTWQMIDAVEECMEIAGASFFLVALVDHLATLRVSMRVAAPAADDVAP